MRVPFDPFSGLTRSHHPNTCTRGMEALAGGQEFVPEVAIR
jgi:hypothetical protein